MTGDPTEMMGLVAHPKRITSVCVSYDGSYVFAAGGSDMSVNMWEIDISCLPAPVLNGEPVGICVFI